MIITPLASGSSGNAYLIECGGRSLLLECGLPFKKLQRALNFKLSALDACLISHEHQDHAKAVLDVMKAGVDCWMSAGTIGALPKWDSASAHRAHILTPQVGAGINPHWYVMPFEAQHDAADPLGFLVAREGKKLLYLTDSFYVKYRFTGLTHIMMEINYAEDLLAANVRSGEVNRSLRRRIAGSHMSLQTAKDMLLSNDLSTVKEIWLLHLSNQNSDEARFKKEIQEVTGKPTYIC